MAIGSPERRDDRDRTSSGSLDDLHRRIDEKRKEIDRRRMFRRASDRERALDVRSAMVAPRTTSEHSKTTIEQTADLIDVHILNIAGQVEALLRTVREMQENVLRVRGAVPPLTGQHAGAAVQTGLVRMLYECDALRSSIHTAAAAAERLIDTDAVRAEK